MSSSPPDFVHAPTCFYQCSSTSNMISQASFVEHCCLLCDKFVFGTQIRRASKSMKLSPRKIGVSSTSQTSNGVTALHLAAGAGHIEIIKQLLDVGAIIEARQTLTDHSSDTTRGTAMHWAARHGHVEVLKELLARGACIETLNEWSRSPLQVACMAGERKAAIFLKDMEGTTLLLRRDLLDLIK